MGVTVQNVFLERHIMTEEKDVKFSDIRVQKHKEFMAPEELYQDLISRVRKYHPSDDISLIERAYSVAYTAHLDGCSR